MNFKSFVDNPVKVSMLFVGLVLLGYLSYRNLPLNLFPDLQTPRITLVVTTKGLTPDETERRLTENFERQLTSIKGVAGITTYSREDSIVIHVDFHWGQDMEFAYLDVKKNVGSFETNENVKSIDVYRFDPNAAALMTLAFVDTSGTEREIDRVQLTSLVENSLRPKLETVEGVAYVKTAGAARQEVGVLVNEDMMAQFGLTTANVIQAVGEYNRNFGGGVVIEGNEQMLLKFVSRFQNVDDVRKCVVATIDNHPIHLEDIGEIRVEKVEDLVLVRQDGGPTLVLEVYREPDANSVLTARRVRAAVENLNRRGDYGLKIAVDRSRDVEAAIGEVVNTSLVGIVLAILVLWAFLRNVPATLITASAIPVSIVATFSLMYLHGLSLNIMTLGGLALGAGMLVDNGIVVVENIFRHRQEGLGPDSAATTGTREVALAITASTLTTIVVFLPLVYVHGIAGVLFKDQALTVVYSLLISLLVALVLVPMLSARIAPCRASEPGALDAAYGRFLSASLKMRWRLMLLFLLLMALTWKGFGKIPVRFFPESVNGRLSMQFEMPAGTRLEETERVASRIEALVLAFRYRDPRLAPILRPFEAWRVSGDARRFWAAEGRGIVEAQKTLHDDPVVSKIQSLMFSENGSKPLSDLFESEEGRRRCEKTLKKVSRLLEPQIVIESVTSSVGLEEGSIQAAEERIQGPNTGRMDVVINPDLLREAAPADIVHLMRLEAARVPGLKCSFEVRDEFLQQIVGKERGDVAIEVHAEELADLMTAAEAGAQALASVPGLANVRTNLALGEECYVLEPDRDAMRRGQFAIDAVSQRIQSYLKGDETDVLKFSQGEMGIAVRSLKSRREGLDGLLALPIISPAGTKEALGNLVGVKTERSVREIMRVNQERTLLAMADLDGVRYDQAVASAGKALDALPWKTGTGWNVSGEEVQRRDSFAKLFFALIVALVLVYMTIAAILESVIHPFTIMLSVPLSLAGVVAAFLISGVSLNLMGYIGIVMLTGIVVNNAIVLLDRIAQIRQAAREREPAQAPLAERTEAICEAVVLAGRQRLRPILMTSLTTILALVPLAMGFGNGAELRRPMAVAVMGGLTSSTLLTLWIMPAIYVCVEDMIGLLRRSWTRTNDELRVTNEE
jgi:HAE1 family hydrophobic/amphiphilic exporter-1